VTESYSRRQVEAFLVTASYSRRQVKAFLVTGDYEECRLLGYENPLRTSQETHYISATESSRLMLC
jgi:hypothetical protein